MLLKWLERGAVALALLTLLVWLGQHWIFHTSSSLWIDEITSIQAFSGPGLKQTLTSYTSNNHMAFSALNAILPGNESFDPLRARIVSLLAVAAGVAIGLIFFLRRGWNLEALLFTAASVGSTLFLKLNLQARGYGLVFLASVLVCIALLKFLEAGKRRDLALFAIGVFIGGWSVPSFLFFAGMLMIFLAGHQLWQRKLWIAVVVAGAIVLAVTIFAYLPAIDYYTDAEARQLMFGDEGEYGNWAAVMRTIETFLTMQSAPILLPSTIAAILVILAGCGFPLIRIRPNSPVWAASALTALGVLACFAICRILETPFVRTTAFLVVPIAFAIGYGFRNLVSETSNLRNWLTTIVSGAVVFFWLPQILSLELIPKAAWKETVELAQRLAPQIKRVHANVRDDDENRTGDYTKIYLSESVEADAEFDEAAFRAGRQLLVDANFYVAPEERIDALRFGPDVVQIEVAQERGADKKSDWQRIAFVPPYGQGLSDLIVDHKPGAPSGQTFLIEGRIADARARAIYLFSMTPKLSKPPVMKIQSESGGWKTVKMEIEQVGNLSILPIQLKKGTVFKISYYLTEPTEAIPGFNIWAGR